ncbi:MAG: hypothetical protein BWX92_03460 [Deltaproteobacteria bacterium ADurb.Bin135]|nr:MAG: hypothetical protein BWX92_03460 [Deltaproteobacteria bacterium ADurb.Bin135]
MYYNNVKKIIEIRVITDYTALWRFRKCSRL